jgi:hypothetical protein
MHSNKKELYKTDNVEIHKTDTHFIFHFPLSSPSLVHSLIHTKLIPGAITNDRYQEVRFKAKSLKTLKELQKERGRTFCVSLVAKMVRCLVKQLGYLLEEECCTILGYHPDDVIVIDEEIFVYLGNEWISSYQTHSGMAIITTPFTSDDFFMSPEMCFIRDLPAEVHFKTAYFSLGCLLLFAILGGDADFYEDNKRQKCLPTEMLLDLVAHHPVKGTRIYWLLMRCLVEDPVKRNLILL